MLHSKKIEEIGKMTAMTQEEIVSSTKTVIQGLDALKNEHNQVTSGKGQIYFLNGTVYEHTVYTGTVHGWQKLKKSNTIF